MLVSVLGALASAAHLFGALFAGSTGAALTLISFRTSRKDAVLGLVIGAVATTITATWILVAHDVIFGAGNSLNWIPHSAAWIFGQFWFMNRLLAGLTPNVGLLMSAVALCMFMPRTRPYALLFALTAILFFGLPAFVSAWRPVVVGRYLTIASPALTLTAMFMAWRAFESQTVRARVSAGLAAAFLLVALFVSPTVARRMTWVGRWPYDAAGARAGVEGCANPRVRVYVPAEGATGAAESFRTFSYRLALNSPEVALVTSGMPTEDVAAYPCRLIGWGEQVYFPLADANDARVLRELGLTNRQGARLRIERRSMGFLVLRD